MGLDKPQTKEIEGHTWVVTPFPGRLSTEYKWALGKIITPALSELAPWVMPILKAKQAGKDAPSNILDMDIDFGVIPTVVATLMKHIEPKSMVAMMVDLMAMSTRNGIPVDGDVFDREFSANDGELYRALYFIVEVNWPDFTERVGSALSGLRPQVATASPQKTQPSSATLKK